MSQAQQSIAYSDSIAYGSERIAFSVKYRERKTMAITVHPDLRVEVIAPADTDPETIQTKVTRRARWILRQKRQFMAWMPKPLPRRYQSGETHRYLGRQYQLKVIPSAETKVGLRGRYIEVQTPKTDNPKAIKKALDQWYRTHAETRFKQDLDAAYLRLSAHALPEPKLRLLKMPKRWGSCTHIGEIILNPDLIKAPGLCIEYVIIHELCHLRHLNHSTSFFQMLDAVLPDWKIRKARLEQAEI